MYKNCSPYSIKENVSSQVKKNLFSLCIKKFAII